MYKVCIGCKTNKNVTEFTKRTGTDKPVSKCRECERARAFAYLKSISGTPYGAYLQQKSNAQSRKKEFKLSFDEWLDIWESSGKLALRGRGKGKYCMCRVNDTGAYEVGNVFIDLCTYNTFAGNKGKVISEKTRKKISKANSGKSHPWSAGNNNPMHRPENKAKISKAISGINHYKQRGVNTPQGYFVTAREAAEALGIKKPTVEWRAKHNKFGFSLPPQT